MTEDKTKDQALKLVTRATRKLQKDRAEQAAAIRFAHELNASYREIAAATDVDGGGISHQQVSRIVDRDEE